jgi:pimeloyl-ACP methyl ester carboxylesterase
VIGHVLVKLPVYLSRFIPVYRLGQLYNYMSYFPYSNQPNATAPFVAPTGGVGELVSPHPEVLRRHNVRVIGHGKPPLLLCNGFGCNQGIWHYLTTALAVQHQVILFDYVGSGESDLAAYNPQKYNTMAAYAQDVVAICQALDLREATIVGHSVGATIAMLTAIAAPQHFTNVVLLAPSPYYPMSRTTMGALTGRICYKYWPRWTRITEAGPPLLPIC